MVTRVIAAGLSLVLSIFASAAIASEHPASAKDTIVFGIVPQQAIDKMITAWTPLLAYLGESTGKNFKFDSAPEIAQFDQRVQNGEFDIVYINPAHYTVVHDSIGYRAIVKEKNTLLKGLIVVNKDSALTNLSELAGKRMVFPGPIAFAATVLPLAELAKLNIKVTPVFAGSHDGVYNDVARGLYQAGGGVEKTLGQIDKTVRDNLRVLWASDSYTPHPIAVHPRVDRTVAEQIQKAMVEMEQNPRGKEILKNLRFKGFTAAADEDYAKLKLLAKPNMQGSAK